MKKAVIFDMYETLITHYGCPLYFGSQMAADAGIPEHEFQQLWGPMGSDRSTGKMSLEQALTMILTANNCFSKALLDSIVQKRTATKQVLFDHLDPEIIPMFDELKARGMRIGLISNCFSEEVPVIRHSPLIKYFDAVFLSYEQGVQKPDAAIYKRCMDALGVSAGECLYVGDGGSSELEAALGLGMDAVQAVWYINAHAANSSGIKPGFRHIEHPLDIIKEL